MITIKINYKNEEKQREIKPGVILYTNWGYDQTNVEFFKVVRINGKKFFTVRELETEKVETGFMSGKKRPKNTFKGDEQRAYCSREKWMSLSEEGGYQRSLYFWDDKSIGYSEYA